MPGGPRDPLVLREEERSSLNSWARSRKCSQAFALRARIVLACEQEATDQAVVARLGVSPDMVRKWRARFTAEGPQGLVDRDRPGRPRRAGDSATAEVLARLLGPPPSGRRWSTRSMATTLGLSQSTVSRIFRTYRLGPQQELPRPASAQESTLLPSRMHDVVGLFVDPPARILAVAAEADDGDPGRPLPPAPSSSARRRTVEAREILAVANAFAQVSSRGQTRASRDFATVRAFVDQLARSVPAKMTVHLLIEGLPPAGQRALASHLEHHPRFRRHAVAAPEAWLTEVERLLARNPPPSQEHVLGFAASLAGLREQFRTWCDVPSPPTRPFTWTKSPRSLWGDDRNHYGSISDSECPTDAPGDAPPLGRREPSDAAVSPPLPTRIADRVAQLVRHELAEGRFTPGERVKEAPLSSRLGVSRGPVREALRVLAEEGMLELLPHRGVAVPIVNAENIIDLYALRASVGALLMRRLTTLSRAELHPIGTALAKVQSVARNKDHGQIGETDLHFQDEIARTARLPQAGVIFERLTMRLRMFNSALKLDWAEAVDLIARENAGLHEAIRSGEGAEAARRWRVKVERSVRYMVAQLPRDHFDPNLWSTLAGKAPLRQSDPRNTR